MFEKTLSDVVKGIRASKRDTGLYISQCIAEIKTELNSTDLYVKANALQKLTFLQMMGYGMSWASFATIEVMSRCVSKGGMHGSLLLMRVSSVHSHSH
jgi:AP-3 complex subunit delta-1